ncbi:MAG: amidase, partial [Clostridia bacterium]
GLPVDGPTGRNVRDTALMLDAMTGMDVGDPLSLPGAHDHADFQGMEAPVRVAYSPDLGVTPVESEVESICRRAALRFEELGTRVEEYGPDFGPAKEVFHLLRGFFFSGQFAPMLEERREDFKPEIIWNVNQGLEATARELTWAERERGSLYRRMVEFFADYDLLLCPATVVPPFDVERRYVTEISGEPLDNYIDWFAITYVVTLTALPVLSLPCGFTEDGLPVGLQVIGPPRGEKRLLAWAAALEDVLGLADLVPVGPTSPRDVGAV